MTTVRRTADAPGASSAYTRALLTWNPSAFLYILKARHITTGAFSKDSLTGRQLKADERKAIVASIAFILSLLTTFHLFVYLS